ncbi:MAG: U32 family peptidase [Chlorobi bacterium]|nr:U32 family peptidase [Chlorobiota bacterium]
MNKRMEIMAPAGDFESLQAAIDNGADSVYFGVEQLNMRARSSRNFRTDDLAEIRRRTARAGVKAYLTLNTVLYDHDLPVARRLIRRAKDEGMDAVIVSDQAAIFMAREAGIPIHLSTQLNISNTESLKFYAGYAETAVLSRELSLRQVAHITEQIRRQNITGPSGKTVKIEIFAHGALCMAISGKCYLSLHTYHSSANRGACKQNCRHPYLVIDKETGMELEIDNEYIMSPKDLMTVNFLDEIGAAGVDILKIEGRARSADYVAVTTRVYREAAEAVANGTYNKQKAEEWVKRLATVYNRGFWDGYYLGRRLGEWANPGNQAVRKKIYVGRGQKYYAKAGVGEFLIEAFELQKGDRVMIIGPSLGVREITLDEFYVNDRPGTRAAKGDVLSVKFPEKIRPSDKIYKIVEPDSV